MILQDSTTNWLYPSGPRFNMKTPSYQYRKSHCGDKTILRPSYLHNEISYTGKMISLYWIGALLLKLAYSGLSRSILWLLFNWILPSLCHQHGICYAGDQELDFRCCQARKWSGVCKTSGILSWLQGQGGVLLRAVHMNAVSLIKLQGAFKVSSFSNPNAVNKS